MEGRVATAMTASADTIVATSGSARSGLGFIFDAKGSQEKTKNQFGCHFIFRY